MELPPVDLGSVAAELYGVAPSQFVAARSERAAVARRDGQRDLAAAVTRLRRPSPSAWVVNLLVRERADDVAQLLELGAQLRAAQASLSADEMRTLGRRRRRVITDLARQGRVLAAERDVAVSDAAGREVEATLEAALADPGAAQALRSGQLVRALQPGGFGGIDLDGAVGVAPPRSMLYLVGERGGSQEAAAAADDPAAAAAAAADDAAAADPADDPAAIEAERRRQAARQQAQVDWEAATEMADRAGEVTAAACARQAEALDRAGEVAALVGRLGRELAAARAAAAAAAQEVERAQQAVDHARSDLKGAERQADTARAALDTYASAVAPLPSTSVQGTTASPSP